MHIFLQQVLFFHNFKTGKVPVIKKSSRLKIGHEL